MSLKKTSKYLKIGKITLYKIVIKSKIFATEIGSGMGNKGIIRVSYNQESLREVYIRTARVPCKKNVLLMLCLSKTI